MKRKLKNLKKGSKNWKKNDNKRSSKHLTALILILCLYLFIPDSYADMAVDFGKLYISNHPESLNEDGILFDDALKLQEPVQLMFSHQNISANPKYLYVTVINYGQLPATLEYINGNSEPNIYALISGHNSALTFLEGLLTKNIKTVFIEPGKFINLTDLKLINQQVGSGMFWLRIAQCENIKIMVSCYSKPGFKDDSGIIKSVFDPFCIHPHGVFSPGYIKSDLEYEISEKPYEVEVAHGPWMIDKTSGMPNTGNFGIIYTYDLDLINKTGSQYDVVMEFEPIQGKSAGSFLINEIIYDVGIYLPYERSRVACFEIMPYEKKKLNIMTFPEAGSCYPVKLIFTSMKK